MESNRYKSYAKSQGPINIALVKYWGKSDEENIIPLNNSLSLTLDMAIYKTETIVELEEKPELENDTIILYINNKQEDVNKRVRKIIAMLKAQSSINDINKKKLSIIIKSINTFPTACGCASSASSMSSLVVALNKVFATNLSREDLSTYARLGSGSACRSIFGGIVEWDKGDKSKIDSHAIQLFDSKHWELKVTLIIISSKQKDISSSIGMAQSVQTSDLLKYRVEHIVPKRIIEIKEAIANKQFDQFAKLTIQDSNNFHAICRDTYPSINYLSAPSDYIMKCVTEINKQHGKMICAYTFDAGSNAFIIYESDNEKTVLEWFKEALYENQCTQCNDSLQKLINQRKEMEANIHDKKIFLEQVTFSLGNGAILLE